MNTNTQQTAYHFTCPFCGGHKFYTLYGGTFGSTPTSRECANGDCNYSEPLNAPPATQPNPQQDKATPRPWARFGRPHAREVQSLVSIIGNVNAPEEKQSIVCNSCENEDGRLIIAAVNQYDAHLALEDAAENALKWLAKANTNGAFVDCAVPNGGFDAQRKVEDALAALSALRSQNGKGRG